MITRIFLHFYKPEHHNLTNKWSKFNSVNGPPTKNLKICFGLYSGQLYKPKQCHIVISVLMIFEMFYSL